MDDGYDARDWVLEDREGDAVDMSAKGRGGEVVAARGIRALAKRYQSSYLTRPDLMETCGAVMARYEEAEEETAEAIANIATATVSDRASVAALTATNSTLTADCTETHSQLLIALQDLAKLHVTVTNLRKQLSAEGIKPSGSSPNRY